MKAAGAALVVFAAVWFIVPPMISDTPVLIRPLERMIGRTFGVRCDIQHARLTLATGWPTISISTMDVYRRDSDAFLAFVDSVDAEFVLWRLLIGSVKTRSMTIARIEVDAPFARLHHFFMQRGFLSHPVMNEASDTAREFLRFSGCEDYAAFYRNHMMTEEREVLPQIRKHFTAEDWARANAGFVAKAPPAVVELLPVYNSIYAYIVAFGVFPVVVYVVLNVRRGVSGRRLEQLSQLLKYDFLVWFLAVVLGAETRRENRT